MNNDERFEQALAKMHTRMDKARRVDERAAFWRGVRRNAWMLAVALSIQIAMLEAWVALRR